MTQVASLAEWTSLHERAGNKAVTYSAERSLLRDCFPFSVYFPAQSYARTPWKPLVSTMCITSHVQPCFVGSCRLHSYLVWPMQDDGFGI